jgi:hypothetical protein
VAGLDQYEIQIPSRVNSAGKHISYTLNPRREKRSSYSNERSKKSIHFKINIDKEDILNDKL